MIKSKYIPAMSNFTIGIDGNEANVAHRVGANVYAFELIKALYSINSDHKFIIYLKDPPRSDFPTPHEKWQYRVISMRRMWSQLRLPWEFFWSKSRPDVFFAPGHYVSPLLPMPVVISILDTAYLTHPEFFRRQDLYQLRTWTQRSVNKAVHILTISQSSKNDILEHYNFNKDKITVTYPGINHQKFYFPQSDGEISRVKGQFGITDQYVIYLGTLQPRKNIENLVRAFCKLNIKRFQLVIAGKRGWMYESIYQLVHENNWNEKVIFTDFVKDEDIPPLIAGAKVLALVSFYEGFGLPVAEALAVGTPAIVSGGSSLPEVLGNAGIKVDPYNVDEISKAINKVINLKDTDYSDLVEKGIKHSKLFRWDRLATQTLAVLEQEGLLRV